MLFDSPLYLLSLGLVVFLYWRLRHQGQNNLLLGFSYFFYGWWDWRFLWLIALSTVADFLFSHAIARSTNPVKRRSILVTSLALNLTLLGFFKYFNFFADSLHLLLAQLGLHVDQVVLEILLPPGISFYTFQAIAYMVDVHQRRIPPVRSLRDYALFISLFPHLIAGPIQRPDHLIPQVLTRRRYDAGKFNDGLMLIVSGLFRKCVVADQCSIIANAAFDGAYGPANGWVTLLGMYAFAWQIYGDFSGYSNIARGSAQLLGFHFMVNFRQPYLSLSIQEFWRRWHMSLSSWLRDYLYIALGGSRGGEAKTYRNLFLTMLIGGFWHGANWTFLVWGALHGGWLAVERYAGLAPKPGEAPGFVGRWVRRLIVFHLVCVAWIFFRARSVTDAAAMLGGLGHWAWAKTLTPSFIMLAFFGSMLLIIDLLESRRDEEYFGERASTWGRAAIAAAMALATLMLAAPDTSAFIYFQF